MPDSSDAVVFCSPYPPFPLDTGGAIRTHRLLTSLSGAFRTTFVTFERHPLSDSPRLSAGELAERLPGVRVVTLRRSGPRPDTSSLPARAGGILSRHSSKLRPYLASEFQESLASIARHSRAALVHFEYQALGSLAGVPGPANVLGAHNLEHRIARHDAGFVRGRRRLWAELDWRKLRRSERRAWRSMDLCLAVSGLDAEAMRSGGASRVEVVPNGTDPADPNPLPRRSADDPIRVLFVGNGEYPPYARGLEWLVDEVLPLVRRELPAELVIVGRKPPRMARGPGVHYAGSVPSVEPWYERAHVAVVPVFEGSGTRLKIPEALLRGRPVVSTRLGAEALPVRPGRDFDQANDAEGFARAVIDVGRRCERPETAIAPMLAAGRQAVQGLTWPRITERFVSLLAGEIDRRRGESPRSDGA
jgi:glycosyltransferase involved in cell wall biosynthesis